MILESLVGSILGIAGSGLTAWFKHKDKVIEIDLQKSKQEHEINMVKAETESMIEEAKANIKITQAQVEGATELKEIDAYITSQKEGNKNLFSSKWIEYLMSVEGWWKILTLPLASFIALLFGFTDFLKGVVRPLLTIYLSLVSSWITYKAYEIISINGMTLTSVQATQIFNDVTSIVLLLTTTCVSWWFADRRIGKTVAQIRGVGAKKNGR